MKQYVTQLLRQSLEQVLGPEAQEILPTLSIDISTPQEKFGDYASNVALAVFKSLKQPFAGGPAGLASAVSKAAKALDHKDTFSNVEAAGGFINFTLSRNFLAHRLEDILRQGDGFGKPETKDGRTIIVEYFQNNVAKPPHVGHLRSAVIGDSLLRVLRFLGFKAISDTHIGDWGVQFGILLLAVKTLGHREVIEKDPITELNKLYVEISQRIESDETLRDKGKEEFKKLEDGDEENRELWQWFVKVSLEDFDRYRNLLGLLPFDYNLGESFYEAHMPAVLKEFESKGLLSTGETGEKYVDLEKDGLGRCILVKSDGATTYHLRDFATYLYRKKEFNFYRNLYIVDNRQSHHFDQLFRALELAGYPAETDSTHIDFGFMSLPEGPISTRKGTTVSLQNLLDEATKRALAIINEKNPTLKDKEAVARQVALAAIKYFDLSHNRKTEIVFTWDQALSFEGNTGPYLQYTHARIYGILRKAFGKREVLLVENIDDPDFWPAKYNDSELALLRKVHRFPEILQQVAIDYFPNHLCVYLFELSQSFNNFYENNPVLQEADPKQKNFRKLLISATAKVLKNGLTLLGIEAPEEM